MLKKLIAPVQKLLLKNGQCVGCGRALNLAKVISDKDKEKRLVQCECGRIFVKDDKIYRRALFEEL